MTLRTLATSLIRPAVCLAVILLVGTSTPVAASEEGAEDRPPPQYVAMGDSFSAASGVLPLDLRAPLLCQRSTRNYPRLIAAATNAQLTDVTCGGATTGNYFTSQYPGVPPQLEALSRHTELVTMTIGLNDSSLFLRVQALCATAGILTLGSGSPCRDQHGSSFADIIESTTYPSLVKALRAVRERAPHAQVAVLGIPWILPADGGCFPRMPVARGDVPYIRGIQATLNRAIQRAAAATGAEFVDFAEASEGHDACQPAGVRWIEPALIGSNPIIVHPNALGEARMAAEIMLTLGSGPAQRTTTTEKDHR